AGGVGRPEKASQPSRAPTATSTAAARVVRVRMGSSPECSRLLHRLCLGELPGAVEDFPPRAVEAYQVVPARRGRQAVGGLAVADAELDRDRAVLVFLRRQVVERVRVVLVLLEIALGVVDADRPEGVNGYVLDGQPVN